MFSLAVLMAAQALDSSGVTEEGAVAAGTRILAAFGVSGPYTKNRVWTTDHYGPRTFIVEMAADDGEKCEAYVDQGTGRCWLVLHGPHQSGTIPPRPTDAKDVRQQVATAEAGMRRLFGEDSVLSGQFRRSGDQDLISIPIAVHGFPFVENNVVQTYDRGWITVHLDARTGTLRAFSDGVPQDPLEYAKPRLDESGAVKVAERLLRVEKPKRSTEWYIGQSASFDPSVFSRWNSQYDYERRLGWYLPQGAKAARLAWRIPYEWRWRTAEKTGVLYYGGLGVIMIDAATEKRLGQTLNQ